MIGALPLTLVMSLIFGIGQLAIGAWLIVVPLAPARRRQWRFAILLFAGLWLVASGATELFVSGMEASKRLTGAPSAAMFALQRGRADAILFVLSGALAVGALIYPLALRWRSGLRKGASIR